MFRIVRNRPLRPLLVVLSGLVILLVGAGAGVLASRPDSCRQISRLLAPFDSVICQHATDSIDRGREIFRYDTFGSEAFWGGVLELHEAIKGEALGGVGPGVSPALALQLGLKVDVDQLPQSLRRDLRAGRVDLNDPAVTVALLKLDAVVGVIGFFDEADNLTSVGISCAICHSTVDDSFAPGIGNRLDGWAAQDLDIGTIISVAPNLEPVADRLHVDVPTLVSVLQAWGPGRFDAIVLNDGKAINPETGEPAPTLIPPAFGLAGFNLHTWTGWGSVTYWNAYVANTQMRGQGTFYDPRLNDPEKYPIAVETGDWNIRNDPDLVTSKLADLHFYQLAIPAPKPPHGFFDPDLASQGEVLFNTSIEAGGAGCARCHVPPLFTEPGWNMHTPEEMGIDAFQANRSPDEAYRTAPLKGLWTHMERGFYHDGRFATLLDVINHYDEHFEIGLSEPEKEQLVEYLKSLGDVPLEE